MKYIHLINVQKPNQDVIKYHAGWLLINHEHNDTNMNLSSLPLLPASLWPPKDWCYRSCTVKRPCDMGTTWRALNQIKWPFLIILLAEFPLEQKVPLAVGGWFQLIQLIPLPPWCPRLFPPPKLLKTSWVFQGAAGEGRDLQVPSTCSL